MAHSNKILKALESAINYLGNSISALKGNDEDSFLNNVWHVAAELEYALFLFSLVVGNGHGALPIKLNPESKSLKTDQTMLKVKELVNEAQRFVRDGDLTNAYKSARLARHYIFKVQEILTKKKHVGEGKK